MPILPNVDKLVSSIMNYDPEDPMGVKWFDQPPYLQVNKLDIVHDVNVTYGFVACELNVPRLEPILGRPYIKKAILEKAFKASLISVLLDGVEYDTNQFLRTLRVNIRVLIHKHLLESLAPKGILDRASTETANNKVMEDVRMYDDLILLSQTIESPNPYKEAILMLREQRRGIVMSNVNSMIESGELQTVILGENCFDEVDSYLNTKG